MPEADERLGGLVSGRGGLVGRCTLALAACLGGTGCYAGNLYTTAQSLGRGGRETIVAPEFSWATAHKQVDANAPRRLRSETDAVVLLPPVIGRRFGVSDYADLAISYHQGTLHGEWKQQLLDQRQGDGVDLAILPALDLGLLYCALAFPVMASRRLGEVVEVVASTGAVLSRALDTESYVSPSGGMIRVGLGVRFWITKNFALQPEGTWLQGIGGDTPRVINLGLGFISHH